MTVNLNEYESLVYNAIMEYLDQNRYLQVDLVVPYLISRFSKTSINLNKDGIISIIKSFLKRNLIVEGSKLVREEILKNPNRYKIYQHVRENPGIYFYKLLSDLNYSNHVIIWHLNILEEFGFIKRINIKKNVVFSDKSWDSEDIKTIFYLRKNNTKIIIQALKNNTNGLTRTQLSKIIKMHPKTVKKYVRILDGVGILAKEKYSYKTLYFLNETKLENIKKKLSKIASKSIEKEIFETKLIESEIAVEKREYTCVVHKGVVKGSIFVCPNCETVYCHKCARYLYEKGEKCWSCEHELDL